MPFCLEPARIKQRTHRQISVIDTRLIRPGAWNGAPAGDVTALTRSIKRMGLLCPILVRPACGGAYELIAGRRRLAACRQLGMTEVECIVMPALDEECLLAALAENACRVPPAPHDAESMRQALTQRHGYAPEAVAALCGSDEPPAPPPPEPAPRIRRCCIRDERLVANAVADMVEQLRRSGVDARLDVDEGADSVRMAVSIPRIAAGLTAPAASRGCAPAVGAAEPASPDGYTPRRAARHAPPAPSPAAITAQELLAQLFDEERKRAQQRKIDAGGLTLAL